ncbi:MAG: penicillin-binding protein 2 [Saprospiraceae bacterium]|nr:penicillin-binding protein 2 [Saprospiraceae bacterium]
MSLLEHRKYNIIYFMAIVSTILVLKAAQLQLFSSDYKEQAQRTTLEKSQIFPSRGLIFDRNGKTLVYNKPIYVISAIYNKINPKMDTALFCRLLDIDKETFIININKDWKNVQFHKSIPFVFLPKVSPEQYAIFHEHLYKFPGFYPTQRNIRGYPHAHAAHVLGYLGEVDKKIIDNSNGVYGPGDYIGQSGLEIAYETELGGSKGINYILKDNLGRQVGSYDNGRLDSLATPGEDIKISIDLELQAYADSLMINKRGGIVAIEPSTGEILAMVSAPSYDPNILNLDGNRGAGMSILIHDTLNRPLNNRAVTNKYPPGSIFKPILSLIALQKGTTYPNRSIYCPGYYRLSGTKVQKCHPHASADGISEAIQYSCNTYYFTLIRELLDLYSYKKPGIGLDTLVNYLHDFGLGNKLGLDYSYENKGFLPNSTYYDRLYRKEANGWRSAWILSLGIGQGEMQLTTVQMANLAAILANRGHYFTPHLIKSYLSGAPIPKEFKTKKNVRIDPKYFPYVIDGLERVVTLSNSRLVYVQGLDICGKTGTSQNVHGEDHSVFFGFAPKNDPKIAIAVFVENAGFGAQWAAPIASLMMEKYINKTISPERKYIQDKMFKGILIENQGGTDFIE